MQAISFETWLVFVGTAAGIVIPILAGIWKAHTGIKEDLAELKAQNEAQTTALVTHAAEDVRAQSALWSAHKDDSEKLGDFRQHLGERLANVEARVVAAETKVLNSISSHFQGRGKNGQ